MYLIEGDINKMNRFKDTRLEKLTLYSAIFSLSYYKGFSVIRTFTIDETALFVCNTANKLKKGEKENKQPYYKNNNNNSVKIEQTEQTEQPKQLETTTINEEHPTVDKCDKDYIGVIKKIKKDNITPNNIGEIMLCQIPGISSVTALAIMDKYKTLPSLLSNLQTDQKCLQDISYITTKGQTRKINKTCIANIIKYLL
jgi:ERCC4-type nuclease